MRFCISFLVFYDDLYTVSNGILPVLETIAVTKLSYLDTANGSSSLLVLLVSLPSNFVALIGGTSFGEGK